MTYEVVSTDFEQSVVIKEQKQRYRDHIIPIIVAAQKQCQLE